MNNLRLQSTLAFALLSNQVLAAAIDQTEAATQQDDAYEIGKLTRRGLAAVAP